MFKVKLIEGFERLFQKDGWYSYQVTRGAQKSGIPDLLFIAAGRVAWCEAKVEPNKLSKLQEHVVRQMANAGAQVTVLRQTHEGLAQLEIVPRLSPPDARWQARYFSLDDFSSLKFWHALLGHDAHKGSPA